MCCMPTHLPALRPWALPGLIPCISTHASQVGAVLGELVAAGGVDLKVLALHIRTADANPDEIQVRLAGCWVRPGHAACLHWLAVLSVSNTVGSGSAPLDLPTPAQPLMLPPQFLV